MNIEQQLDELKRLNYPREVDVVEPVMAEVRKRPYLMPRRRHVWVRRLTLSAAAVAAVAIFAVPALINRSYDEDGIGEMIASVQDYSYYSHVESAALNPIEYLYDEQEYTND